MTSHGLYVKNLSSHFLFNAAVLYNKSPFLGSAGHCQVTQCQATSSRPFCFVGKNHFRYLRLVSNNGIRLGTLEYHSEQNSAVVNNATSAELKLGWLKLCEWHNHAVICFALKKREVLYSAILRRSVQIICCYPSCACVRSSKTSWCSLGSGAELSADICTSDVCSWFAIPGV